VSTNDTEGGSGDRVAQGIDLAGRLLGGSVIAASDESFGEKENLLDPGAPVFEPGRYGPRGELVDGWETGRRRTPGFDWALVRLGIPGILSAVDIDTSHFTGNYPQFARLEGCGREGYPGADDLTDETTEWIEIASRLPLRGDAHNVVRIDDLRRFTHLRLSIFPDGGVARLRAYGSPMPDPRQFDGLTVDLAGLRAGGAVVFASDEFFTSAEQLIRPEEARSMGEGWETRRRRDDGHDTVVVRLGLAGRIEQLVVDTSYFRYNASAAVEIFGSPQANASASEEKAWQLLLPRTALLPDTRHVFRPLAAAEAVAAIRIDSHPDGGLSRIRAIGTVDPRARRDAGYRWFNALPEGHARECLELADLPPVAVETVLGARPLSHAWLASQAVALGDPEREWLAAILEGP